jgi:hypothetical protein
MAVRGDLGIWGSGFISSTMCAICDVRSARLCALFLERGKGGSVSQGFHPTPAPRSTLWAKTERKKRSGWHADSFYLILDNVHHARARYVLFCFEGKREVVRAEAALVPRSLSSYRIAMGCIKPPPPPPLRCEQIANHFTFPLIADMSLTQGMYNNISDLCRLLAFR